jgi:hypothetical protein
MAPSIGWLVVLSCPILNFDSMVGVRLGMKFGAIGLEEGQWVGF